MSCPGYRSDALHTAHGIAQCMAAALAKSAIIERNYNHQIRHIYFAFSSKMYSQKLDFAVKKLFMLLKEGLILLIVG